MSDSEASKPSILIIDDSIDSIHVLSRVLEAEGDIRFALTGRKGLELARHQRPDLVLLDIELGDTSGFAVLQRMREIEGMETVPVLFVSFHDDSLMEISALRAGAEGLLSKVASPNTIRRRVQEFLSKSRLEPEDDEPIADDARMMPPRVVMVENQNVLSMAPMAAILQTLGAEVALMSQYDEILTMAASRQVHLVIVVARNEDDSWIDPCRLLREVHPDTVLVVASGDVTSALEEKAVSIGSRDVFDCNSRPLVLRSRLKHVLRLIPRRSLLAPGGVA